MTPTQQPRDEKKPLPRHHAALPELERHPLVCREDRRSKQKQKAIAIACLVLLMAFAVGAQLNRFARGRNIVYPEYNEKVVRAGLLTNQMKGCLILGEGEYLPNGTVLGNAMRLEQYTIDGRTNLVARAPECIFNPATRLAWSTGRLDIVAMEGRFNLSGRRGFQANLTNTTLIVSNRVRTVLQQNILRLPSQ